MRKGNYEARRTGGRRRISYYEMRNGFVPTKNRKSQIAFQIATPRCGRADNRVIRLTRNKLRTLRASNRIADHVAVLFTRGLPCGLIRRELSCRSVQIHVLIVIDTNVKGPHTRVGIKAKKK